LRIHRVSTKIIDIDVIKVEQWHYTIEVNLKCTAEVKKETVSSMYSVKRVI